MMTNNFSKHARQAWEGPATVERPLWSHLAKNIPKPFFITSREEFPSFRKFPSLVFDTVNTKCDETKAGPTNIRNKILPGINLPRRRTVQIKIEKLCLGPNFWRSKLARRRTRIIL